MDNSTVLVVDDDKEIAGAISKMLSREGINNIVAYDGLQALQAVAEKKVDLVVIDIMMPKMDGLSATMQIRQKNNIPIILLSAKSEDSDKILGLSMGADDYVTKPYNPAELLARVKSHLRRYKVLGSAQQSDKNEDTVKVGGIELNKKCTCGRRTGSAYRYRIQDIRAVDG